MTRCTELKTLNIDAFDGTRQFIELSVLWGELDERSSWVFEQSTTITWNYKDNVEHDVDCIDPNKVFQLDSKPRMSFVEMIKEAINKSERGRLHLSEIYKGIMSNHTYYYNDSDGGWKNSVRHALSSSGEFLRITESRGKGFRGSEWCIKKSSLGKQYQEYLEAKKVNAQVPFPFELDSSNLQDQGDQLSLSNTSMIMNGPLHFWGLIPNPDFYVQRHSIQSCNESIEEFPFMLASRSSTEEE